MAILYAVDLLPAGIASHSNALIKLLFLFFKLVSVFIQNELQELDCPSFEGKHEDHITHFVLSELFRRSLEDVNQLNYLRTHEFCPALAVFLCQTIVMFLQQFQHVLQQLCILKIPESLKSSQFSDHLMEAQHKCKLAQL